MKLLRCSLFLSGLLAAVFAPAEVAFSSFGNGNSFNASDGYTISSESSSIGYLNVAQQFTSATTGKLTSIAFAAYFVSGAGSLKIGLYADDSNGIGTELASWGDSINTSLAKIYSLPVSGAVSLAAGKKYWLGLLAQDESWLVWNASQPQVNGLTATSFDSTPSISTGGLSAFRIQTTQAVPEPSTVGFLALGSFALLRRRSIVRR